MRRHFRGKNVSIEVRNPAGVCRGVAKLTVDGESVAGNLVPPERLREGSRIVAVMG
jgi:hypothetical protein